jgi:hypothetical protein
MREPQPHRDHFTPQRQVAFLAALADCGSVRAACARIGISAQSAYLARRRAALFAAGWDAALVLARSAAEEVLAVRALDGVEEPVFYRGKVVGTRRRHDSRLLLAHLARLDAHADRAPFAAARAARFDELLARLGGEEAPQVLWDHAAMLPDPAPAAPDPFLPPTRAEHVHARTASASLAGHARMTRRAEAEWDAWGRAARDAADRLIADGDAPPAPEPAAEPATTPETAPAPEPVMEFKSRVPPAPQSSPCTVSTVSTCASAAPGLFPVAKGRSIGSAQISRPARRRAAMLRHTSAFAAVLALAAINLAAAAPALANPVKLAATLTGDSETPPGKVGGTGGFTVELDPETNDFCYQLWAEGIGAPTMAHIHSGAAGASGPPVVTLDVTGKNDDACIAVEKDKLDPIVANPAGFYVNVHTAEFPAGAVRGQLAKP